jgi:hypothetical protein
MVIDDAAWQAVLEAAIRDKFELSTGTKTCSMLQFLLAKLGYVPRQQRIGEPALQHIPDDAAQWIADVFGVSASDSDADAAGPSDEVHCGDKLPGLATMRCIPHHNMHPSA